MTRQSTAPVQFTRSQRSDAGVLMTSARAGVVSCLCYVPLLRGESCSGSFSVDVELAEMPRPLLNGVSLNVQAWFVPKSAHPQFTGMDEFRASYQGTKITSLGAPDREPPTFFVPVSGTVDDWVRDSDLYRQLGIHVPSADPLNTDLVDAFSLIHNFRLAAYSSRLARRLYCSEIAVVDDVALPPAFWPSGPFSRVVPDYEKALVLGDLELDVQAGRLPLSGLYMRSGDNAGDVFTDSAGGTVPASLDPARQYKGVNGEFSTLYARGQLVDGGSQIMSDLWAEMAGQTVSTTLASIDKARTTQAFAKLRTAYAGNDTTGFSNDDAIVAELMQGFSVPVEEFGRPWLLSQSRVTFGFAQRFATDGDSLDQSVSQGVAQAQLRLNVPQQDVGGCILVICEVLPDRVFERSLDPTLSFTDVASLPDALRDIQRPEPVDFVFNKRLDAAHTVPDGLYGYEPMNAVWNRVSTRLGGIYYQSDPSDPFKESRSAIWSPSVVDPLFTRDHFLAPVPFPHDVFSDTLADAYDAVVRHTLSISGLTQMGDVLVEDGNDYDAVGGVDDEV
uniref:Major capsid protein n=1 Tax=uncultured prokaryote TaxID=198431 RepID=A0A0H5Q714_9ZZZZ|nr:hypothetical protein [uncultured prokaryote]